MNRAAVLGGDVSRSLSPRLHQAAAAELGIALSYEAISCPEESAFHSAVDRLRAAGAIGANVTVPYKLAALARSDQLTEVAAQIGAVNRLHFAGAGILGDNTDGPALVRELGDFAAGRARVQLLGAGGAARAVAWALAKLDFEPGAVVVTARDRARAEEVAALVHGVAQPLLPVDGASLIISTLPGSAALAEQCWAEWIDPIKGTQLYDLAYGSADQASPLVLVARARGLAARDGLGMLVEQAALSFLAWLGGDLPKVRRAMWASLGRFDTNSGRA